MDAQQARAKFEEIERDIKKNGSVQVRNDPQVGALLNFVNTILPAPKKKEEKKGKDKDKDKRR